MSLSICVFALKYELFAEGFLKDNDLIYLGFSSIAFLISLLFSFNVSVIGFWNSTICSVNPCFCKIRFCRWLFS